MSLLSVTVKKAQFSGAGIHQWNSYVTLKLQHVKSTTVTVKGANPSWEQDFLFEVNNLDAGLLIEVWSKGVIWDKAVGYHWLHLRDIHHSNVDGAGQWLPLEEELVMRDGEVVGTRKPTGHAILIDARFEQSYGSDIEGEDGVELQRKLVMLNSMLDQEARAEHARKQHQYYIQTGVSEDSDYTSDVNYPIGQNPNSSASQFLSTAINLSTPQRSLTCSRENSYEKNDDYYRTNGGSNQDQLSPYYHHHPPYPPSQSHGRKQLPQIPTQQRRGGGTGNYWDDPRDGETEPLYYNSRPQSNYKSYGRYRRRDDSWEDEYDYNQKRPEYATSTQYEDDYDDDAQEDYSKPSHNYSKRLKNTRRGAPSLERQYTLYDGTGDYAEDEIQGRTRDRNSHSQKPRIYSDDDPYASSYSQQNTQPSSVYNDYNQDYGDYYENEAAYGDETYVEPAAQLGSSSYEAYGKDSSGYGYDGWDTTEEMDTRDHYSSTTVKSGKELPPLPVSTTTHSTHHSRGSQLSSQAASPFTSQSTVKEVAVTSNKGAGTVVPSSVQSINSHPNNYSNTHHEPVSYPSTAVTDDYDTTNYGVNEDVSFYDESSYSTQQHPPTHPTDYSTKDAVVPNNLQSQNHQESSEQYVDAYETQGGYDEWQNYGYYDESGNWISYDQNSSSYYQDESGNFIPNEMQPTAEVGSGGQDPAYSSYYDQTQTAQTHPPPAQIDSTATYEPSQPLISTTATADTTIPATTKVDLHQQQQPSLYEDAYNDPNYYQDSTGGMIYDDNQQQYQDYDQTKPKGQNGYDSSYYQDQDGYWYDATQDQNASYATTTNTTAEVNNKQETQKKPLEPEIFQYEEYPEEEYKEEKETDKYDKYPATIADSMDYDYPPEPTTVPNDEYNYAYQSTENLTAYDSPSKLHKSESVSRRASFRRQHASVSEFVHDHDHEIPVPPPTTTSATIPTKTDTSSYTTYPYYEENHVPITTQSLTMASSVVTSVPSSSTFTSTTTAPVNVAAVAASKITSEIKSALPGLTSLTKGKGDLFSGGLSKLGSFMSNAAAKTGVSVPLLNQNQNKDLNKEVDKGWAPVDPAKQDQYNHEDQTYQYDGMGQEYNEQWNDQWNENYDEQYQHHEEGMGIGDQQYNQNYGENGEEITVPPKPLIEVDGPVHMDSLESNVSEGARDAEDLEAEYWQKQQERIAKQSALQAQESEDYYPYDTYDNKNANLLHSIDSVDERDFRQNSLDNEEFIRALEKQSGTQIRPSLAKKDTMDMSMSMDRSESIDQGGDYIDEYDELEHDRNRQESYDESAEGSYPLSPPPHGKIPEEEGEYLEDEDGPRKSSLEIQPKEKSGKTVSFEEEPPKHVPDRQTKGMTPREKWLWAVNRICAQLAVS